MKKVLLALIVLFVSNTFAFAQSSDKVVSDYIKLVSLGRIPEVKMALPDLLAEYPNDPGIKLLHAVVIDDANKALDIYVYIVNNYPSSQWADDAYWRIVQYYAITGNAEKATFELGNFRKRYPTSIYLGPATDVVRSAQRIVKSKTAKAKMNMPKEEKSIISPPLREDVKNVYTKPKIVESEQPKLEKTAETIPMEVDAKQKTAGNGQAKFGLQIGVFREIESAEMEKEKYIKKRIRTEVVEREINGETMFSVVVGDYSTRDRAEKAKRIVSRECGCTPIVLEK
jgi:cell division septation protein DedD